MFNDSKKLTVILVGLPGSGKTCIAKKLSRYLNWKGCFTKIFCPDLYLQKLKVLESKTSCMDGQEEKDWNTLSMAECLKDLICWLKNSLEAKVAILDSENLLRDQRALLKKKLETETGSSILFIESVCNINQILVDGENTFACERRVQQYQLRYESLDELLDPNYSFLKLFDVNKSIVTRNVEGHISALIVYFLINARFHSRTLYFSRHGESEYNLQGILGGDSDLSLRGVEYASKLHEYFTGVKIENLQVWTSPLKRARQTAQLFEEKAKIWKCLEEIKAGICEGMTYQQISELYPEEFRSREKDKYNYRYPRGESYYDVVVRLEPIMLELERANNVLIIGHQAVLRCILAYFLGKSTEELPFMEVPLHSVLKISAMADDYHMQTLARQK
ncbi:6-phosphofructo-2-kinase/fructose-2,6-bisphosphatase-like isoform X2 [Zophobas morio]|uniref:6-phosphofructo-2-kinase/fructose-2, 6-bisphosphatase-like isoform X2 n=1 Tax=Zophobas morio TaxID=2755281 RepID=UPI0030830D91